MKNGLTKPISTFPATPWKIWLLGIVLFIVLFLVIKGVSDPADDSTKKIGKKNKVKAPTGTSDLKIDGSVSNNIHIYDDEDITLPSFPKGEKAFVSYIQQNIHVDAGTKGRAIASFVVAKNGSLIDIKILRSVNEKADQEVIRVLSTSPKWNPGKKKVSNEAVDVAFSLPVNFAK